MAISDSPFKKLRSALRVIAFDKQIGEKLLQVDPKALEQAVVALLAVARERHAMFADLGIKRHAEAVEAERSEVARLESRLKDIVKESHMK